MGALTRGDAFVWLRGAALIACVVMASTVPGRAENSVATPFANVPQAPRTFPIVGNPSSSSQGSLPLVTAAAANNAAEVSGLLDARVSPDETEVYGRTALIYAAMNDNPEMAQALVAHGAKVDLHDNLGKTALHWAAERGSMNVLRVLLQANAQVDVQTREGLTPLMLAAKNGRTDAVRRLLQYHADPRKNDYTGRDAVSWAENRVTIVDALKSADAR